MTARVAAITCIAAGLSCCQLDGGEDPGPDAGCVGECLVEQANAICRDFFVASCHYLYRCYSGDELAALEDSSGFSDEASCVESFVAESCSDAELGQAVREGRQRADSEQLAVCQRAFEQAACVSLSDLVNHLEIERACEEVVAGERAPGEPCQDSDDCAGLGGYCNESAACELRGSADYQIECDLPLEEGECPGVACMSFVDNAQGLTGTCTRSCAEETDCGYGAKCLALSAGDYCLAACMSNADCSGGLVCRIADGNTVGICFIDPL